MANPTRIELGAYAAGEIPPPVEVTFTDFDGAPIDLTGFGTRQMNIESIPPVPGPLGGNTPILVDGPGGVVQYQWTATDMATPADYTAQLWVSDGTFKYASDLIIFTVYDGPGVAP